MFDFFKNIDSKQYEEIKKNRKEKEDKFTKIIFYIFNILYFIISIISIKFCFSNKLWMGFVKNIILAIMSIVTFVFLIKGTKDKKYLRIGMISFTVILVVNALWRI